MVGKVLKEQEEIEGEMQLTQITICGIKIDIGN